jgi:hypothetical protein
MGPMAGPFIAVAFLLAVAGALKLIRPSPTANALAAVGLPRSEPLVRAVAVAELAVAVAALVTGHPLAAGLVALGYLVFAGFVVVALRAGTPLSSCGCFGVPDTPPTVVHVGVNVAAAGVATAVALGPGGTVTDAVAAQPAAGIPFLLGIAVLTWLLWLSFTALPRTLQLARHDRDHGTAGSPGVDTPVQFTLRPPGPPSQHPSHPPTRHGVTS